MIDRFEFWLLCLGIYLKFVFYNLGFNWPHFDREKYPGPKGLSFYSKIK